jgi:hypothetical protein
MQEEQTMGTKKKIEPKAAAKADKPVEGKKAAKSSRKTNRFSSSSARIKHSVTRLG